MSVGIPLASRTTPCPKRDQTILTAFKEKAGALAAKYRTELLPPPPQ